MSNEIRNKGLEIPKSTLFKLPQIKYEQLIGNYIIVSHDSKYILYEVVEVTPDWHFWHMHDVQKETMVWLCVFPSGFYCDFGNQDGNFMVVSVFKAEDMITTGAPLK